MRCGDGPGGRLWTVKRSLNLLAVWGRFGSDGARGRYLPSSAGAIDAGYPAPEPTPAEALAYIWQRSACPIQSSLAIWHRSSSAGANGRPAK